MLKPIGLSNGKVFRYYGTFSLDRRVCSHLSDGLLKGARPSLDGVLLQRYRNQPVEIVTELRRSDSACLVDELARQCNATTDRFVGCFA